MLLVIPIIFSFIMWFRVSLATPPTSASTLQVSPPLIYSADSNLQVRDFGEFSFSPRSLNFSVKEQFEEEILYFPGISFYDTDFMEITSDNAKFINYDGQMGLELLNSKEVNIRIKLEYYPFIVMFSSWFIIISYMLSKRKSLKLL